MAEGHDRTSVGSRPPQRDLRAIGIGEQCYQLGEDAKFRWVTEEQFDAILPPGIEHDRYVAMTNTFDSDGTVEEWAENWDSPSYWARAAEDALDDGQAEGAYWTTRDEDPDVAAAARASRHRRSPLNWTR